MGTLKRTKLFSIILVLGLLSISPIFANEAAVKEVVNNYLSAVNQRADAGLKNTIAEVANFTWLNKIINKSESGDKGTFIKAVTGGKIGGWGKDTTIKNVNVYDKIAVAYVEVSNAKLVQKEIITLMEVGGKWQIVSSTFSIEKA